MINDSSSSVLYGDCRRRPLTLLLCDLNIIHNIKKGDKEHNDKGDNDNLSIYIYIYLSIYIYRERDRDNSIVDCNKKYIFIYFLIFEIKE